MIGDGDIRKSLREVADFLREQSEETGYGFFRPENPHDFTPDANDCSEAEIAAHKAACDAWDRGEYVRAQEPAVAYGEALPPGVQAATFAKDRVAHVLYAPWGIGTYTLRDKALISMADRLDEIADRIGGS